ncbi:MAG: hypothetical protein L0H96_12710 [Humibacillus sp.]|nr:hypothetical protein [Humibacillus sp.]MDN5777766.1 hypothetical protein [Humibacillus sp.]
MTTTQTAPSRVGNATLASVTETVVRNHLRAFWEQEGVDAIVKDYHDAARFQGEAKIRHGKHQGRGFVVDFLDALPAGARERFTLRSLQVEGNVAYITSNVRRGRPCGH